MGDKFHLKLNTNGVPIAYKYREGKMKRTLRRGLKGTEIAESQVEGYSSLARLLLWRGFQPFPEYRVQRWLWEWFSLWSKVLGGSNHLGWLFIVFH